MTTASIKKLCAFPALMATLTMAVGIGSPSMAQGAWGDYRLHAGDTINVSVWKEEELQQTIVVRPDGKFSFPLAGEIVAAGRSAAEVKGEVEAKLKIYIPEPVVSVSVQQVGGNRIYVVGQVRQPGSLVMNPQLNVLQALAMAEGGTPFAKLDDIIVIRNSGGQQQIFGFRYSQVTEGRNLSQNINLESGDVVVVP